MSISPCRAHISPFAALHSSPWGSWLHSIPQEPRAHGEVSPLSAPPPLSVQSGGAWGLCRTGVLPVLFRCQLHHWQEHHGAQLLPHLWGVWAQSSGLPLDVKAPCGSGPPCWKTSINDEPVLNIHTLSSESPEGKIVKERKESLQYKTVFEYCHFSSPLSHLGY